MDAIQEFPHHEGSLADKTSRALERLRERADALRADELTHWQDIESQLKEQLDHITEELAREQEACSIERKKIEELSAKLTGQVSEQENRESDLNQREEEIAHGRTELEQRTAELANYEVELGKRETEITRRDSELTDRESKLSDNESALVHREKEWSERDSQLASRETEHAQREAELSNRADALSNRESALQMRQAELEKREEAFANREAEFAALQDTIQDEQRKLAEYLQEQQDQLNFQEQEQNELSQRRLELDQRDAELQSRQKEIEQREAAFAAMDHGPDPNAGVQAQEIERLKKEVSTTVKELESVTIVRDRLAAALAETEEKVEQLSNQLASQPDVTELERKFELAMEEARRLRAMHAELEEDLANRSNIESGNSQEIVNLRSERDALIERIEELERKTSEAVDPSVQEQCDELQRRLELAVDDLRALKNEKAELEQKLQDAQRTKSTTRDGSEECLDWEAMKRNLLMSLDEDFDRNDAEDNRERATIEGTIQITDEVVEKKDQEIAELTQLLAEQSNNIGDVSVGVGPVAQLFDENEAIHMERDRLRALQAEWEEKQRQAELEFSVQRAKFAREKNELELRQRELDEARAELEEAIRTAPDHARSPKRRWLSRLGLNKEEE